MNRSFLCALLVGVFACGDGAGPGTGGGPRVRIAGPDTAAPGDTVLLAGSANDPEEGGLPASALRWSIRDSEFARGYEALIVMPASGSVEVKLAASDSGGSHADTTHTITVAGPGTLLWQAALPQSLAGSLGTLTYAPDDGTLYVSGGGGVVALSRDRSYHWKTSLNFAVSSPAVGPGGMLYVADLATLRGVDNSGAQPWTDSLTVGAWGVDPDGNVAGFTTSGGVKVIRVGPTGAVIRSTPVSPFSPVQNGFFIDRPGNAWAWTPFIVTSYTKQGDVAAEFNGTCGSSMIPGTNGVILLVGASCLGAYHPVSGVQLWGKTPSGFTITAPPAVGRDGTMYFGLNTGVVVAIASGGAESWRSGILPTGCTGAATSVGTPAVGADGTVFFHASGRLVALTNVGAPVWVRPTVSDTTQNSCSQQAPVLLTSDGRLFTVTGGGLISAFAAGTVADSLAPWGQYLSDERHSRRAH